ncbi:Acg family FMN-binding oxidoreductase [Actinophytocola oryzae]|uniref:Nitroreductase family protein n=1 Tax=Actinophytocola oryzae TaxID=502181 RepID=A0A4R7V844_9PSEU|nr:nitroreductase family protein [Actinophytocola oryzae]TDV44096.1 nitroreductase family protein [Actinophytocola oryzae]
MTSVEPDRNTVLAAVGLANRAPSVHNTQPWRWLVGDTSVHLVADRTRHVPATDPDGRDLLLSCGAALHHLRTALVATGWEAVVHYLPDEHDPDHLATVVMRPSEPTDEDIALAGALPRRRTDRRRFTSWEVPAEHLDLLVRRAAHAGGLLVPVTDSATRWRLTRAIDAAALHQADDPDYLLEVASWSRSSFAAHDGVLTVSGTPVPTRHDDTAMRAFPGGSLGDAPTGRGEEDGGRLLVLASRDDDTLAVLRAGEAASAALLTATDLGLATCPLSQPLEVTDTRTTIRDQVLDGTAYPHLILRVGWAPTSAPLLPHSPVRRTEDTVGYLPGACLYER